MTMAQEVTVRFTGRLNGTTYQRLDNVVITNNTRNWTETITYPDTVIVMSSTVDISENGALAEGLGQNMPNPFDCQTRVQFTVSQCENVRMQLLDASGKICADYNGALDAGTHEFEISAANPQTYILNAVVGSKNYSIRMVNVGSGCSNYIKYYGVSDMLMIKLTTANEFNPGDNMIYVGHATIGGQSVASEAVSQWQYESQMVVLDFINNSLPCVSTYYVDNVTSNTAICSGNVTSDGGAAVTARGVCWSTSQNPTVSGNHTTDGTGTGSFTSTLTGLEPETTYYVRAYATNSEGTAYGEQVSFTTISCQDHEYVDL